MEFRQILDWYKERVHQNTLMKCRFQSLSRRLNPCLDRIINYEEKTVCIFLDFKI